ncbi:MAG: hypothetical protein NXI25_23690 [bacterium]|nr:hypothetical protein [bacterium]
MTKYNDPNTPQNDIEITQAEAKRKSRFLPGSCTTTPSVWSSWAAGTAP